MSEPIRPRSIRLETSTFCQLKCPSCPTARGETQEKVGSGFLKFKDLQKVIDENPWIAHIELSNWGEIFLNPDLPEMIKYAYRKSVALTASNGANLNTAKEKILELLVKSKFRHITCSIDGASQETYSIYRVGGNFERVIENIKTINHYKAIYQSVFPLLTWQFVAFGHNEHEIQVARELAKCDRYKKMKETGQWLTMRDVKSTIPSSDKITYSLGRLGVWITNRWQLLHKMYLSFLAIARRKNELKSVNSV